MVALNCNVSRKRTSAPVKAHDAQERKEEKDYVQREEPDHAESDEVQLLQHLRVRNLFLRLPEERVPLPGT